MCDKAAGVPFPAHPASCHFVATVPWGTWVAADIRGGLMCVVRRAVIFSSLAQDLLQSWPFGLVFPIWCVALCSSSEDVVSPKESH